KGEVVRGAAPDVPLVELRVFQERHERAGRAAGVAEPEVARVGVVVVGGLAHERETEEVAVERRRALEVCADERDVVQPGELHAARGRIGHARNPRPPDRRMNARRRNGKAAPATTIATTSTASFAAPAARTTAPAANPASAASSVV